MASVRRGVRRREIIVRSADDGLTGGEAAAGEGDLRVGEDDVGGGRASRVVFDREVRARLSLSEHVDVEGDGLACLGVGHLLLPRGAVEGHLETEELAWLNVHAGTTAATGVAGMRAERVHVLRGDPPRGVRRCGGEMRRAGWPPGEHRLEDPVVDRLVVVTARQRLDSGPEEDRSLLRRRRRNQERRLQRGDCIGGRCIELDEAVALHLRGHAGRVTRQPHRAARTIVRWQNRASVPTVPASSIGLAATSSIHRRGRAATVLRGIVWASRVLILGRGGGVAASRERQQAAEKDQHVM